MKFAVFSAVFLVTFQAGTQGWRWQQSGGAIWFCAGEVVRGGNCTYCSMVRSSLIMLA